MPDQANFSLTCFLDAQCEAHEFKCLNNKCINKNLRCNGVDDCGENDAQKKDSDEENCIGKNKDTTKR